MSEHLYRMYDAEGTLLYIGISKSAIKRLTQHMVEQPWVQQIAKVDIEQLECDRTTAMQIEREAIIDEKPKYNVVHNGRAETTSVPAGEHEQQTGAAGKGQRKKRWMCDSCHRQAKWIQYVYQTGEWQCVCREHDPYPAGMDGGVYVFECDRVQSDSELASMRDHLAHKSWFDYRSWMSMLQWCRDRDAKRAKSVRQLNRDAQVGDYVMIPANSEKPWTLGIRGAIVADYRDGKFAVQTWSALDGSDYTVEVLEEDDPGTWRIWDDLEAFSIASGIEVRRVLKRIERQRRSDVPTLVDLKSALIRTRPHRVPATDLANT